MVRILTACLVIATLTGALAYPTAEVPASGEPVIIEGLTPGVTYVIRVWGNLWYRSAGSASYDVHFDECFERSTVPPRPAHPFRSSAGVPVCGETVYGWARLQSPYQASTFVATDTRMVAWVDAPPHVEALGHLTVEIYDASGRVGRQPHQLRHCILRRPRPEQPTAGAPVCFDFEAAYAFDPSSWRLVGIEVDTCVLTEVGLRSGWEIDPTFGGPHPGQPIFVPGNLWQIWYALTPEGGDFYGCLGAPGVAPDPADDPLWSDPSGFDPFGGSVTPPFDPTFGAPVPFDPRSFDPRSLDRAALAAYGVFAANSCPWAFDGECDEPGIGTGLCAAGTDTFDCWGVAFDWSNSCPWAFDGECDEPGIGTGVCLPGTDTFDCGVASFDWSNSCPWAFDGECDEPIIGTGVCLPGTDTFDCAGVVVVAPAPVPTPAPPTPAPPTPEPPLPENVERRERALDACDVWSVANSGGAEGTVDVWDIRAIPDGAVFDLRFDARSEPDRYRVAYAGVQVYDSGWRGASHYDGDARFDGGVAGPGRGEALDLFVKRGHAQFTVIVVGGTSSTVWDYRVRCRLP